MINTRFIDTSSIPKHSGVIDVKHKKGNTRDIINVLLVVDKEDNKAFDEFAKQFPPTLKGLKLLWSWVKNNIRYVEDGFGHQYIKYPEALFGVGEGDCKSFTVFVNQVLKRIGLSYYTRFAGYDGGEFTHVYTVVLLNGRKIILDAVYHTFGKEVRYTKKEDHMTQIAVMRGTPPAYKKTGNTPANLEEVLQRKQYIPDTAPVQFHKNTLAKSHLLLFKQRLQIFGAMRDGMETAINQSLNLVNGAIKEGRLPDGVIDDALQPVASEINFLLSSQGQSTGHGIISKRKAFLRTKAVLQDREPSIGNTVQLKDLGSLFFNKTGGTGSPTDPYTFEPLVIVGANGALTPRVVSTAQIQAQQNALLFWGRNNFDYWVTLREFWNDYQTTKADFMQKYPGKMVQAIPNSERYGFANAATYDLFLEEIKENSGVLTKWVNSLFRVNKQGVGGANPAPGTLYSFINAVQGATYNDFPEKVRFKSVFQEAYLASCVNFSGVDPSLIKAMTTNGIMADMGGHDPQTVLKALLANSTNRIGILDPATLTAIIGIVTALLTTTGGIITAAMNEGAEKAALLDQSMKDSAQFQAQNMATIPQDLDFAIPVDPPPAGGNNTGGGSGGGSKNKGGSLWPLGLGLAAAYVISNKDK